MMYFMRQMTGANNKAMQFGKTNAKTNEATRPKVKFSDVAGIDEAVEELEEVRDFLAGPERFRKLGTKIPAASCSSALRAPVRPCSRKRWPVRPACRSSASPDPISSSVRRRGREPRARPFQGRQGPGPFDHLHRRDRCGRSHRGAGLGGGHDEREQTLNQLLARDGRLRGEQERDPHRRDQPPRYPRSGAALLPFRPPDHGGPVRMWRDAEQILRVHAQNKPFVDGVSFKRLAQLTVGFTGADLANLLNEAALLAARRHRKDISMSEIEESIDRVIAGPERKARVMTETERTTIAYHESGHALVGHLLEHADPVHKITIIPRGAGLGLHHVPSRGGSLPHDEERDARRPRRVPRRPRGGGAHV